jgi:DNA polymerase III subunit delta
MPQLSVASVRKQIEAGRPDPIYLIHGDDEIEKSALAAAFTELVDEGVRDFNVEKFHGGDMTTADRLTEGVAMLVAAARTLPMMSPRRVITLLQAELLITPKRESEAVARALGQLEELVKRPEPHTTLVLVAASVDKRSRLYKLLVKQATLVECGVLENRADAERWVRNRVAAAGQEIDPAAAGLLATRAGSDVQRLRADLDRLMLYTLGQERITADDVRAVTGPEALQNEWAIADAIESGQAGEALRQLGMMFDAGGVPEKILGQLGWLVRAKFPAVAPGEQRRAVDAVFRTDLDLKRSAGEPRVLLERLVVELCAGKRSRSGGRRW